MLSAAPSPAQVRTHLTKEWVEQRSVALGLVVALIACALLVGFAMPARWMPARADLWFGIGACGAALLLFGGDLVPGERRRGQLGFLLRTPGALRSAWWAKLIALTLGLAALFLVGILCAWLCDTLANQRGGEIARTALQRQDWITLAFGVGICAPWIMLVSCSVSRGANVLPLSALVLAIVVAPPIWLTYQLHLVWPAWLQVAGASTLILTGIVASRFAFVRGMRFGSGARALSYGMLPAAALAIPLWSWSGVSAWHGYYHADPTVSSTTLQCAGIATDGNTAIATLSKPWGDAKLTYPVMIDLKSGAWEQIGDVGETMSSASNGLSLFGTNTPQALRYVVNSRDVGHGRRPRLLATSVADGALSLTPITDNSELESLRYPTLDDPGVEPIHLPGGAHAGFEGEAIVVVDRAGQKTRFPYPHATQPFFAFGFGWTWFSHPKFRRDLFLDLTRQRFVHVPRPLRAKTWTVRPGVWIADLYAKRKPEDRTLVCWDPDTAALTTTELESSETPKGLMLDGRVLVQSDDGPLLFDPDSKTRQSLVLGREGIALDQATVTGRWLCMQTPEGADVLSIQATNERGEVLRSFARRQGNALTPAACIRIDTDDAFQVVAIQNDGELVVVVRNQTIERWTFGSDQREILFRVGDAATEGD